jgi:polyphosphate kinase 2 (PPK2 family)
VLYAENRWSLLLIFQGMDAAGKDSAIKHVMSGLNPQGTQVYSFKRPSDEELDHDYLWRSVKACPSAAASASSIARITRKYWSSRSIRRSWPAKSFRRRS